MPITAKPIRAGFLVAASLAAFAIVVGACSIFLELRDRANTAPDSLAPAINDFLAPVIMLSLGIALAVLTWLGESSTGPHKVIIILRNSLIVIFALAVIIVLALYLVGAADAFRSAKIR